MTLQFCLSRCHITVTQILLIECKWDALLLFIIVVRIFPLVRAIDILKINNRFQPNHHIHMKQSMWIYYYWTSVFIIELFYFMVNTKYILLYKYIAMLISTFKYVKPNNCGRRPHICLRNIRLNHFMPSEICPPVCLAGWRA